MAALRISEKYTNAYFKELTRLCDMKSKSDMTDEQFNIRKESLMHDIIKKQDTYLEVLYSIGEACRDKLQSLSLTEWVIVFRPKTEAITFVDFYNHMKKLSESSMYTQPSISFEQTGTSQETLGEGFHCNFVFIPGASLQGMSNIKRDLNKRFKDLIEKGIMIMGPGIHIQKCRDGDYVQKYMIEYVSVDGHKEPMKEWDKLWRNKEGIQSIYYDSLPCLPSSRQGLTWN